MSISFALFGLLIIVAVLVWVSFIKLSDFLSPRTKAVGKGSFPIESGERSISGMRNVGFQYFFYALIFVVLEAISVLVFLWAESAKSLALSISLSVLIALFYMVILVRYLLRLGDKLTEDQWKK
ncbi:MAG: NADH-quinone oxidoreductase subunit A [Candidatus Parvarchaeum sp.]